MNKINTVTKNIKNKALEIGFNKVGIASPEKLEKQFLIDWLENGFHAEMRWMENKVEERTDPEVYFPGVKSIVSTAVSYYNEEDSSADTKGKAQISRYAAGQDYHNVVKKMQKELLAYINELIPGVKGLTVVDTSPVSDKIWAAKAGSGWIGKNSNLITRDYGSYVFLGEIFLDSELIFDKGIKNYCGTCTQCIDACPTNAIVEPYVVNSEKCISYRTIEHKGDFPDQWYGGNADWLFGCDICQDVCPWNKYSKQSRIESFLSESDNRYIDPEKASKFSDEDFRTKYKDSPVKRCKPSGFRRNAQNVKKYFEKLDKNVD